MNRVKESVIFALGILVGLGIAGIGYGLHRHVDFAVKAAHLKDHALVAVDRIFGTRVRAAKQEHIVAPAPYFPPGAIWNKDISHEPVDPQSSAIIGWLADAGGWGANNKLQIDFSMRVLQAGPNTPYVPLKGVDPNLHDSDHPSTFPLPAGGGTEDADGYQCNVGEEDCHLLVADRAHGKLYEAYKANYTDGALNANFVTVWDLNRVYPPSGRGDQCSSTDAAGFPIAPLLFNADEIATGSINHAIRFVLPPPRIRAHYFVHPATHIGGATAPSPAPPFGIRLRLKASYDVSQLMPEAQVVARAMQKYGMFLADSGNIALTAQRDLDTKTKYADIDFDSHAMKALKVTDFEVVDMSTPIHVTFDCVRNP